MDGDVTEVLSEIRQLLSQYRAEVPGNRRAWPESIKNRVLGLRDLGLNFKEISRQTGIPYFTVLAWRDAKKKPGFELVRVVSGKVGKSATATKPTQQGSVGTVTVTTFKGTRIEGISEAALFDFVARLEGGR
jgi:hypothetical protein